MTSKQMEMLSKGEEEVIDRLKVFVTSFVYIYERNLLEFFNRLENQSVKPGKWADLTSNVIRTVNREEEVEKDHVKAFSRVGNIVNQKLIFSSSKKNDRDKLNNLMSHWNKFREDPSRVREALVRSSVEIFQCFESQFAQVTADGSWERAMGKLAHDAVNRVLNYSRKNIEEGFCSSLISKGVVFGQSEVYKDPATGIHHINPGHELKSRNSNSWNTEKVFENPGLITKKNNSNDFNYYKKKSTKDDEYGYRHLFEWEFEDKTELAKMLNGAYQEEKCPTEEFFYTLKREDKSFNNRLCFEINNSDSKLLEKRMVEIFQEEIDLVRQNAEDYFNELEMYIDRNFGELSIYIKNNQNEINEMFRGGIKHYEEANQKSEEIAHAIDDGINENKTSCEVMIKMLDKFMTVKVNQQVRATWFDVRESVQSFAGRQEQLDQIGAAIKKEIIVISGLAGVGKTELAVKYARTNYTKNDSVIWINAETSETARSSFRRLLKQLGLKTIHQDGDKKIVRIMAKDVYDYFDGTLSLFIFDNAVNYSIIRELLPKRDRGYHIIITSQNRELFNKLEHAKIELDILPEDKAIEFVKNALKINNTLQNKDVKELIETLGRLPLALQHAVAYIKESGFFENIGRYVEILGKSKDEIQCFLNREGLSTYDKTIFLTFKVTIDKVNQEESGKLAGEILNTIAYFASENIPKETLLKLVQERVKETEVSSNNIMLMRALNLLCRYSIINSLEEQVSIHRLVQQVIRLHLGNKNEEGRILEEEFLSKALVLLKEYTIHREGVENYLPHIISVWNYANKYNKLVENFVTNNAGDTDAYTTYLHSVAGSSSYEVVEAIIKKIDPNKLKDVINGKDKEKRTPLHNAAFSGVDRVVRLLIESGANVNATEHFAWTALHLASDNGHVVVVKVLLENGANINAKTGYKFTPLHLASRDGHYEVVDVLLEKGIDVNPQTKFKFTPLHLAAENNHLKVVQSLLKSGGNVNAVTEYKFTPLHFAAKNGHLDIVRFLLRKDAEIDALDNGNFSPLHLAALNGHSDVVNVLLGNRASINIVTTKGNTPLHLAAHYNHPKVVASLIERNCNINIENEEGKTALNFALGTEVEDYIRQYTFSRRPGTAGIKGQLYEINLLIFFLIQGAKKGSSFYLATNVKEAGDFDDVVLKYETGTGKSKIIFVQAKHRENPEKDKITMEQLYSESEKGDFSLKKYFTSYRKIKQQFSEGRNDRIFGSKFEDVDFIIFTNALSAFNKNEESFEKVTLETDSIFSVSRNSNYYYKILSGGEINERKINVLQYSSDCRRLARDLAQNIISEKIVATNEGILRKYHLPLAEEVLQRNEGGKDGKFRESFLKNDSQFRSAFFDEVRKGSEFASMSEDELQLELKNKKIKLSENFGKFITRKIKSPEFLPNDVVTVGDIKDFLSKIKLFVDQSSEEELSITLKHMIQELYNIPQQDIDTVFSDVQNKVLEWWKKGNNFLTESNKIFQDAARISIKFDVKEPVTFFTGRRSELENLHELLENGGEAVISHIASVTGLGGIGKSELARKYICEHSCKYDNNIIWINADNYLTISESFRRLAQDKLHISTIQENGKEKDIKIIVEDVYSFFGKRHRRCLFVFDNAGKYKAAKEREGIYEFLPCNSYNLFSSYKPSVLITSRDREWGEINCLPLDVFTEEEADSFIRKALQIKLWSQESEITDLGETLHRLPLAMQQAVAYINKENQGKWRNEKFMIKNYLQLFQERANELLDNGDMLGEGYDRYTETVLTTWHITIEKIKQKRVRGGQQALDILEIISYLAADKIPVDEIFSKLIDNEEIMHSAVELLDQYSMATLESGKLSLHRLVQKVTRIELEVQGKNEEVVNKTFMLLKKRFFDIGDKLEDYSKKTELLPHLETFLSHIDDWLIKNPAKKQIIEKNYLEELLILISEGHNGLGNPRRQKELLERALPIVEEYYGPEYHKFAMVLTNLSSTYGTLGDPWKEKELAERALSILFKNHNRSGHFEIVPVVLNLGNAYEDLGDHDKKKVLLEWALSIEEERKGTENLGVAKLLASLSTSYGNLGDFHMAKDLLHRALAIKEKYYGREHFKVAVLLTNLGNSYGALGEYTKKKELLERALAIEENHYGSDHFNVATALGSLGYAHRELGDFQKAKEMLERALKIEEKHYGPEHFKVATTLLNLGIAYMDLDDFHEAKDLLLRALSIEEKHYGSEYFQVARILVNLGNVYGALNDYTKQKDLLERALFIFEKHYGSDNYDVAKAQLNLGVVYGCLGDNEKKKELLELALPILEKHYGPEDYEVSILLTNLGIAYRYSGNFHKAKDLLVRSLAIKEKHFGPAHFKITLTIVNLGNTYSELGDFHKAKELLERAVTINEKHYGPEHFEVAILLSTLCNVLGQLKDHQRQKECAERALTLFEKEYGPEHFEVAGVLHKVGIAYWELGNFYEAKEMLERALKIKEKHYGPEHFEVGAALVNLSNIYGDLGEHKKKRELLEKGLPILEKQYGSEHDLIAKTLKNLGVAYLSLQEFKKAKECLERAVGIEEKCYGPEYFEIAKTLGNLSVAHAALGEHKRQLELLQRALKIEERHYGLEHIELSSTLGNLGNAYGELDDFPKAIKLLERSLTIEEKHYGVEHIALAVTLQNLYTTYGYLGDHEKEIAAQERALRIFEKHYGLEHIAITKKLEILGISYGKFGNFHKAKELIERALSIKENYYGSESFELAESLLNLCNTYERLGEDEKRIELLERTTRIFEKQFGLEHIAVASTLDPLGNAYGNMSNFHKGKELQERALKIKENHYGPEHFELAIPLLNLGTSYGALGDHKKRKELLVRSLAIFEKHEHPIVAELREEIAEMSSLHFACRNGDLDMVNTLLVEGANVLERNDHDTVLHRAVSGGNVEIVTLILNQIMMQDPRKKYEHINTKDAEGDTPLMWAAEKGKLDIGKLLLENGADVKVKNNNGETALHWAVKGAHQEFVVLLLNKKADSNIRSKNGKTPLDLAREKLVEDTENDHFKMIAALLLSVETSSNKVGFNLRRMFTKH